MPSIAEQEAPFLAYMSRHLVPLACEYQSFDRGTLHASGTTYFTGFVLELHDAWYWVTAGHCLKDLDAQIRNGVLRILGGRFMDYFGSDATYTVGLPYTYEPGSGIYLYDREQGLDFGLLRLNELFKAGFKANGVAVISRKNWMFQPDLEFQIYKLLGIPASEAGTVAQPDGSVISGCRSYMFDVERLEPADVPNVPSDEFFVARMSAQSTIASIEGMSGGPIFGFRMNSEGRWAYHVVAVQSSWLRNERIIMGCPLPLFAERIHQIIESSRENQ